MTGDWIISLVGWLVAPTAANDLIRFDTDLGDE